MKINNNKKITKKTFFLGSLLLGATSAIAITPVITSCSTSTNSTETTPPNSNETTPPNSTEMSTIEKLEYTFESKNIVEFTKRFNDTFQDILKKLSNEERKDLALRIYNEKFALSGDPIFEGNPQIYWAEFIQRNDIYRCLFTPIDEAPSIIGNDDILGVDSIYIDPQSGSLNITIDIENTSTKYAVLKNKDSGSGNVISQKVDSNKLTVKFDISTFTDIFFLDYVFNSNEEFQNKLKELDLTNKKFFIGIVKNGDSANIVFQTYYPNATGDGNHSKCNFYYDFNNGITTKWVTVNYFSWFNCSFRLV